jgi:serine protease Do
LNGEPIYITTRGNGREYPAHLAASNEKMDIAILCSLAKPGRTARIINSEHIRPGDRVHAAGHPSGKMWQITEGTVSRMSHRMHYIPSEKIMVPRYNLFVSAFIHYGNSGGPLFDAYGNVIGMITEFEDYGLEMPGSIAVATPGTDMLRFIRTVWGKS